MCNLHLPTMSQLPTQKFGYLYIKQSSTVKSRKLKSWRRRWAVLTKMSNLSSEEYIAKLDLFVNETKWQSNSSDKMTFVLENVTCIQNTSSRTHKHAFEIVESQPNLVMSGATELESYSWILALQQIFTPEQIETTNGCYKVTVLANECSSIWNLSGQFTMSVSPTCIGLVDASGSCVISWGLSTLMRFNVEKDAATGQMTVLVIESGPNAPTGQSCFHFLSPDAQDIMCAIRQSICLALSQKQQTVVTPSSRKIQSSVSERSIQNLPDNHPVFSSIQRRRTDSESSSSTTNYGSSTASRRLSSSPVPSLKTGQLATELDLLVEIEENTHISTTQLDNENMNTTYENITKNELVELNNTGSSSNPNKSSNNNSGYSEIKDVTPDKSCIYRRNSSVCEPTEINFERHRSISTVVAAIKASTDHKHERSVSFENNNNDKSDIDSAISSMTFSAANDDLPWKDLQDCQQHEYTNGNDLYRQDRKKSSSTPDLQAYWKKNTNIPRFENVYEELDELRASVRRLSQKQKADTPPELPARPVSVSFTSATDQNQRRASLKKRKSVFEKHENFNFNEAKVTGTCFCDNGCYATPRSFSDCRNSNACRDMFIQRTQRTKSCVTKTSREKDDFNFCLDEMNNRVIPEIQRAMQRDSTDITRVENPNYCNLYTTDTAIAKTNSLPSYGKNQQESFNYKSYTEKNLINERNDVITETLTTVPGFVSKNSSNPLINFFLDDDNFHSNPMVTGELPPLSTSLSTSFDLWMNDTSIGSLPLVPFTVSSKSNPAVSLKPQNITNSLPSSSSNIFNTFDIWNSDIVNNQATNKNIPSPTLFSNSSCDSFKWNQSMSTEHTSLQSKAVQRNESSYMTMLMKFDNSRNETDFIDTTNNFPFVARETGHITASEIEADGIYVKPSDLLQPWASI